jgi:metal-responsive CopG/Arc/MetJ family transcriptional regulator
VKTAISVPDDTFSQVEQRSRALGMSRSEFYTVAARHYLQSLDEQTTTEQINDALAAQSAPDHGSDAAAAAGRRRLAAVDEEW